MFMFRKSFFNFSITFKLLSHMANKVKVNSKSNGKNKIKSLIAFFMFVKKFIKVDYLTFNSRKFFYLLRNT